MKIIKRVPRPHGCHAEIEAELENAGEDLWFGSIVECSCGQRYYKHNSQTDGAMWALDCRRDKSR